MDTMNEELYGMDDMFEREDDYNVWEEEGEVFSYARYIQGVHVTIFLIGTASTLDWYLFHRKWGCQGSYVMFKIFCLL